ncbi:MAG: type II toxin-antitoxin system HicA family toxin [Candidatus Sungbacteria bacterium]|nr:type II toxin-antitoxin system HicA family toxin [Candidatus Sungbacteria bacterium]
MRPITAKRMIRILRENGFIVSRQRGSHMIWKNPQSGTIVPIPLHRKNKPIPIGTLHAIIKQSKIPQEKFK